LSSPPQEDIVPLLPLLPFFPPLLLGGHKTIIPSHGQTAVFLTTCQNPYARVELCVHVAARNSGLENGPKTVHAFNSPGIELQQPRPAQQKTDIA
jgi:hypothetical protein